MRARPVDPAGAPQVSTRTDSAGMTRLHLAAGSWLLQLRHGSFVGTDLSLQVGARDTSMALALYPVLYRMPERLASAVAQPTQPGVTRLAPVEVTRYPAPTPDPIRILRVLPGVASGGDQAASAYSVRGGSWDENLVRIEGVDIDAPQLLRTGLGETLSPINGDMMQTAQFHSGVLPARMGDRLSSALEIDYRRPDSLEVFALTGRTRQAVTVSARTGRTRWIVGARRADLRDLTSDLQTDGKFTPYYGDVQGVLAWGDERFGIDLFGLRGRSGFALQPESRVLRYNCGTSPPQPPRGSCDQFAGQAFGSQRFEHDTDLAGARVGGSAGGLSWVLRAHHLRRSEREDTDETYLADWIPVSYTRQAIAPDWVQTYNMARGRLQHDRSQWTLAIGPASGNRWELGGGSRSTDIDAVRTAADTLWLDGQVLTSAAESYDMQRTPVDHFAWGRRTWAGQQWQFGAEVRTVRFGGPNELLWLPKARLARTFGPWRLALDAGLSAQPALVKELLQADGMLVTQKGGDAVVELERQTARFRWRGTAFYRHGWDRISYTVEDAALRYAPDNDSRTRALGAETQVRGQVGRAVGTLSYSFLRSRENLAADGVGWVPTATDQRHTATAYLEDRMNLRLGWLQASRFHIRCLLGSGFPYTAQVPELGEEGQIVGLVAGERHARRDDAYIRFDIGTTQVFRLAGMEWEEVANLFDEFNAVSYRQLPAPDGSMALLPRGLGRRVYNAEISLRF